MKTSFLTVSLLLAISMLTCNFINPFIHCEEGSGEIVEQELQLAPFNEFEVSSSAKVTIRQAAQQKVVIRAQQNIIDLLNQEIEDEEWDIKFKKCIKNGKGIEISIELPSIEGMEVHGSGSIQSNGVLKSAEMEVEIAGSGDISAQLETTSLTCGISGSGNINLEGSTENQKVKVNGSGDVNTFQLQSQNTSVKINGSGDVRVNAQQKLNVKINGSGDVTYSGNPAQVEQQVNGSGSIKKAN